MFHNMISYTYIYYLIADAVVLSRSICFFFQAEDGIRDLVRSRGLGDVYKRQGHFYAPIPLLADGTLVSAELGLILRPDKTMLRLVLSLIHISEPTRPY